MLAEKGQSRRSKLLPSSLQIGAPCIYLGTVFGVAIDTEALENSNTPNLQDLSHSDLYECELLIISKLVTCKIQDPNLACQFRMDSRLMTLKTLVVPILNVLGLLESFVKSL